MFEKINTLMESEETKKLLSENEELLTEAINETAEFPNILKNFVIENFIEFLGENTQETYKNVRLFTEVATAQYMTEISTLYGSHIESEVINEASENDYL